MSKIWRVIFDTNVLVAALKSKNGASFQLLSMLKLKKFEIALSLPLYMEYRDVLMRSHIKPESISNIEVQDFIDEVLKYADTYNIYFLLRPWLKDEKDDMVLEAAVSSGADFIVTFNLKDFDNIELFGIEAITPKLFLEMVKTL